MGIHDRRYSTGDYGEGGGFRRALRRTFGEGDNPLTWAFPLFRVAGVTVKLHVFYLIFIVGKLIWPLTPDAAGFWYSAMFMGALFLFVLLHEFGHVIACRKVGGEADEIIMWPLGGLALCVPPRNWKANFITTICGPLVNVALAAVFAAALLSMGADWRSIVFNPLNMWGAVVADPWFSSPAAYWKYFLYACFQTNVYMVLFNVLLPMFPMDGGRILQEIVWKYKGYKYATRLAANVGFVLAVLIGMYALLAQLNMLFSICFFCGATCFMEKRRLAFVDDEPDWASGEGFHTAGYSKARSAAQEDKAYKAAVALQKRQRATQAEVDRILDKIRTEGMGSLTRREKAILKDETERKRSAG